jgi:hypothetical protein
VGLLIPCSEELVGSNPTPRAILGESCDNLFLAISGVFSNNEAAMGQRLTVDYSSELNRKIDYVTQHNSKGYYRAALKKASVANPENANTICHYIMAEQTQMNIKESTKEGKMTYPKPYNRLLEYHPRPANQCQSIKSDNTNALKQNRNQN